jgi:hypothetical protein
MVKIGFLNEVFLSKRKTSPKVGTVTEGWFTCLS